MHGKLPEKVVSDWRARRIEHGAVFKQLMVCELCGRGEASNIETKVQFRKRLVSELGWLIRRNHDGICPRCHDYIKTLRYSVRWNE